MNVYDKAVNLLAIREHNEKELRAKLSDKGYSAIDIDSAIEKLKGENLLSDMRFAESYIRSRLRKSPEGKSVLLLRLLEKGTSKEMAKTALDSAWNDEEWLKPLSAAIERRASRKGLDESTMYFRKKGFTQYEVKEALKLLSDTERDTD